jgi:D-3-phosphoglycerate dehydrogenase / 2-oxoglutarate reductase
MKIAILDDYQDCVRTLKCFEKIKHHEVTIFNDTVKDNKTLSDRLSSFEALVLTRQRSVIDSELISLLPNLKVISQTGKVGSHVDLEACRAKGITVLDGQGSGEATAELNMLLILASLRHLSAEVDRLKHGLWQGHLGYRLKGRVLGVYGFGKIGQQICRLGQAFGANIQVWGRPSTLSNAQAAGYQVAQSKEAFFSTCDVLSVQLRLTPQTKHIIKASDLALMKQSALFVNASRAELVETNALYQALLLGRPGFAAVDVYEDEPVLAAKHPLIALPNCLCTPHLGFVERDNYEDYYATAFDNINAYSNGLL